MAVPAKYNVFDVGTLGGNYSGFFNFDLTNTNFTPSALNDRGELAGISLYAGDITAGSFIWRDGKLRVLPTLPNGNDFGGGSNALGINDWGLVIGISNDGQGLSPAKLFNHAVVWWDGQVFRLPDLGGDNSGANFVNNFGLVVGYANNTTPDPYSFYGTQYHATTWLGGRIRDLGTLGGTDSEAWTANDKGEVIGISYLNTAPVPPFNQPQDDAFLWSEGEMKDLGNLGGGFSTPSAINQRGDVTVISFDGTNQHIGSFLWRRGNRILLNSLGGPFFQAVTLNNEARMAGSTSDPSGKNALAAVWEPSGKGLILGTVDADPGSIALGINDRGVVVGGSGAVSYTSAAAYNHAFVWHKDGTLRDLNTLIPANSPLALNVAYTINSEGVIAGLGTNAAGETHAFVLVPDWECEPGTYQDAASAPVSRGSFVKAPSLNQMLRRPHRVE